MITVNLVGRHEVRLAEPALIALRLRGNLLRNEAGEIVHVLREHLAGRDGRILVDVSELGSIPSDWLHELDVLRRELDTCSGYSRDIAFVRTHLLHKVLLAPLMTRANANPAGRLQARFFQGQDDALAWLQVSGTELFAAEDAIYVTRVY